MSDGLSIEAKLDWRGAPEVLRNAPLIVGKATQDLVTATMFEIVAMGAVDTGHMLNSVHGMMTGATEGEVRVGASYARYVHDGHFFMNAPENVGTYKFGEYLPAEMWGLFPGRVRYAPPRPFLRNAVEIVKPRFVAMIREIFR